MERYAEIMAAQASWSASGQDVNAKLQEVFGLNAADFGKLSGDFAQEMTKDYTLAEKLTKTQAKYEAKYAVADADADLTL